MAEQDSELDNVVAINFGRKAKSNKTDLTLAIKLNNEKKRKVFEQWIALGVVSVLLDARSPGVKVPPAFAKKSQLVLNFSYDFHVPDFNFNDVGVWATLSFDSGDFFCMLPWPSIFGMQSAVLEQGMTWFDDFERLEHNDNSEPLADESSIACKNNVIEFDFGSKKDI